MAFQISPGVNVSEIDLTTIVPSPSTTDGAYAGGFRWGPINDPILIDNEDKLKTVFGKPDALTYKQFFTCANFLQYGNKLRVSRAANSTAYNADTQGSSNVLIKNDDQYYVNYDTAGGTSNKSWFAKYAGDLGNSLKVSVCGPTKANTADDGSLAANTDTKLIGADGSAVTVSTSSATATASANISGKIAVGDVIDNGTQTAAQTRMVASITSNTVFVLSSAPTVAYSSDTVAVKKNSGFATPAVQMMGTVTCAAGNANVAGSSTKFNSQVNAGDIINITVSGGTEEHRVNAVSSATALTLHTTLSNAASGGTYSRKWEYANYFDYEPTHTSFAERNTATQDMIHIVVADEDGEWTGTKGEVLETYSGLSLANNATAEDGSASYYKNAINRKSDYLWWGTHEAGSHGAANTALGTTAWGATIASGTKYHANGSVITNSLSNGSAGSTCTDANIVTAYDKFRNADEIDVALLMTGDASNTVAKYCIDNISSARKDCIAFISPEQGNVVDNSGSEADDVIARRNELGSSSYAVMDGGYKYMYDKYSSVYRYVPLNGDIAGLCARTDTERDPWYSPGGFNRGGIKGAVKLSWNPRQSERDDLYKNGVNPIVTFTGGLGTILFGDKTLLARPSAFDRINVRRLFIILEKAIANAAKFSLFEFNDDFTRSQFVSLVEPFLRDVQGRNGIFDFKVVCDTSNNTGEVIDRNEFRADIYVKPNRSINFIQLNFVAVRTGVEFSEVVGQF